MYALPLAHRTQSFRLYRVIIEACCSVPHAQDVFVMLATYGNYKAVTDMMDIGNIDVNAPCRCALVGVGAYVWRGSASTSSSIHPHPHRISTMHHPSNGSLALLEATRNAHDAVVDRLLHNPAINLEVTSSKGHSPPRSHQHHSPTSPYSKIWTYTPEGMTALVLAGSSFAAVPCKFAHIVTVLVDGGADVLAMDRHGNTVLVRRVDTV